MTTQQSTTNLVIGERYFVHGSMAANDYAGRSFIYLGRDGERHHFRVPVVDRDVFTLVDDPAVSYELAE